MATNSGDLVLDPTCGSGTTAYVAEQWGRRWITIDTSRVALALARSRVMGARYFYYLLADSASGQKKGAELTRSAPSSQPAHGTSRLGFVYDRVPHVTLKAIANNTEIDVIWDEWRAEMEPLRDQLNEALFEDWPEWEIPRDADVSWPDSAKDLHERWQQARAARQAEIDKSIAAKADFEYLYDLVNLLLEQESLRPTYPPYPGREADPALETAPSASSPPTTKPTPFRNEGTRVPWQEAPDRMYQATRQPDYAGWYLDTDRERLPVLMWAGDLDEAGTLLIESFGEDATFEVRPVERTLKELKGIADRVSDMRLRFDERGILLVETEYNVKRNRIDVGIKATKKKQAVAERMLAQLGDAVRVRRVDVPQFDS